MNITKYWTMTFVLVSMLAISSLAQNRVLVLDGSGDLIDLPESASMASPSSAITIEALVNLNAYTDGNILASGNQHDYAFRVTPTGKIGIHLYRANPLPNAINFESNSSLALHQWYHIAVTYNGTIARLFINGVMDAEFTGSGLIGHSPQYERYSIGCTTYNGQYNFFVNGKLDEVRLWNIARTPSEIAANICFPLAINDRNGLVGYWQFEGNYSDATVNGNNGVPLGNAHIVTETVNICSGHPPVPDVTLLPDLSGECIVQVTVAPTATSFDQRTITGTTTDPLLYSDQGMYTITWVYDDGYQQPVTQTQTVIVQDETPPIPDITVLTDLTGECAYTVSIAPTATDNCNGTITGETGFSLPFTISTPGTTTLQWTYTDNAGNITYQSQNVVISDNTAPSIAVVVQPENLWPPNHKMVKVTATVQSSDNCGNAVWELESITSNEPDNGLGDGDKANDIQGAAFGTPDDSFWLRAERSGKGNGRIYTVTYKSTDGYGNISRTSVNIAVAHNMAKYGTENQADPGSFSVDNFPNPFRNTTMIRYHLSSEAIVRIAVYDKLGREVALLDNSLKQAGDYKIPFDAGELPQGVYYCIVDVNGMRTSMNMVLER